VAALESSGEASAAEVSAAQVATDATATHGTAEVPTAKAPTHASAEVTTTHRAAEVPTAHASAPMTARVATGRNGAGRDDGTSQCHGNNDARDSMHPHDGVSVPNNSTMSLRGLRERNQAMSRTGCIYRL
jgi:hypothetical protein